MAGVATDLQGFLVAYSPTLSLTFGTNLFVGLMPDQPDAAVSLFEYPGGAPRYVMGAANSKPAIANPHIQVVVRQPEGTTGLGYPNGHDQIEAITNALETICNQTINGTYYERVERLQDPFFLHRDVNRRISFACNFSVERTPS